MSSLEERMVRMEERLAKLELVIQAFAETEKVGRNPGPILSSDKPVTAETSLEIGKVLQAEWGGQWWAARVLEVLPDGDVKIHYLGWSSAEDDVVPRSRLQLDPKAAAKAKFAAAAPEQGAADVGPGPITSTGNPVTADTPLKPGDILQIGTDDQWWAAKVLDVLPDGQVKIHYLGWEAGWDAVVPRSQLQLDPDAAAKAGVEAD